MAPGLTTPVFQGPHQIPNAESWPQEKTVTGGIIVTIQAVSIKDIFGSCSYSAGPGSRLGCKARWTLGQPDLPSNLFVRYPATGVWISHLTSLGTCFLVTSTMGMMLPALARSWDWEGTLAGSTSGSLFHYPYRDLDAGRLNNR